MQALGAVTLQLHRLRERLLPAGAEVEADLDQLGEQLAGATDRLRELLFSLEPTEANAPIAQSIRVQAAHVFDGSPIHWSVDDLDGGEASRAPSAARPCASPRRRSPTCATTPTLRRSS